MNKHILLITLLFFSYISQMLVMQGCASSEVGLLIPRVSVNEIQDHIAFFSGLGSRFTGYPGSLLAAEYIAKKFLDFGLNVTFHKYKVLVPLEKNASIQIISGRYSNHLITGYALFPNLIQTCSTPPDGISGKLILARNGLEELAGKNLNGSVVLMDFNSGQDWIRLSELGAAAVIFSEPSFTDRMESMSKFLQTPLYFPRLYISEEDAIFLRMALEDDPNLEVKLIINMSYEWVEAVNVIGILNGTEPNNVILVTAHYDSWSVIPSKSPAADEAVSVASLIELARYFSQGPIPSRSLWFVAFSGHWQGLAGAREFVNDVLFSESIQKGSLKIWMTINLDFSTGSDRMSIVRTSHFYKLNVDLLWETWVESRLQNYIRDLEVETGIRFSRLIDISLKPDGWWGRIPLPYVVDSDAVVVTGSMAISFVTSEDMRIFWGTPLDDLIRVNIHNLLTQLIVAQYLITRFANEQIWDIDWEVVAPRRLVAGGSIIAGRLRTSGSGFATLQGRVVEYNMSRGWFDPVPYALVTIQSSITTYPFSTIIVKSDEEGAFSVHGLIPFFITKPQTQYIVQAWALDDNGCHIKYAPNLGLYGGEINTPVSIANALVNTTVAVFKCKSVILYHLYDPYTLMKSSIPDKRSSLELLSSVFTNILPYDFSTGAECLWYGRYFRNDEPIAMLFIHPEERFIVKIDFYTPVKTYIFLVNSSSEWPEGYGYKFGQKNIIHISVPSQAAIDMYNVARSRYEKIRTFLLRNPSIESYLDAAEKHLVQMLEYRNTNMHGNAHEEGLIAWSLSIMAYNLFMSLLYESSTTVSVVVAIIIPAALFLERLVTSTKGYKRFISLLLCMVLMFSAFGWLFPGLKIASVRGNPFILIMTIPLAYILIFSLAFLVEMCSASIKRRREEKLGVHEIGKKGLVFLFDCTSIPIGYMKRRKFRTILILVAIIANSLGMTAFASISPIMLTRAVSFSASEPSYQGYLFKRYDTTTFQIIDEPLIDYLRGMFGNRYIICPRVWVYPQTTLPTGDLVSEARSERGSYRVAALMGVSAYEANVLFGSGFQGIGFEDQDTFVCLIPQSLSKVLNVTIFDSILWNGIHFTVKGIFDENAVKTTDLDGYSMIPFEPSTVPAISRMSIQESLALLPASLSGIIVIPYNTALKLNGILVSVAVRSPDLPNISSTADTLSLLQMHVIIGKGQSCYSLSRIIAYELLGLEPILILSLLASLNILAIMLGAVNERKREINIHSALGLDPKSSSLLFLFETSILSIVGISLGYLIGINLNYALIAYGTLPEAFAFNYSSRTVLIIIVILLVFSLSSTAYPAYIASKMITPSHERKWKISSKPKDSEWEIQLPFVLSKHELAGFFRFLAEYYVNAGEEVLRTFKFKNKIDIQESSISSIIALAPYEANITQLFILRASPAKGDHYTISIILKQLTGIQSRTAWISSNYNFIDSIRKQFLIWRSFSDSEKRRYMQ